MIDPASIVALLAAGALAKAGDLGGQAVMDAYAGLKQVLVDTYRFTADRLLEKKPADETARKAAEADIAPEATRDPRVAQLAEELRKALADVPPEAWRQAGVVIDGLTARLDIEMGKVAAGRRGVRITDVRSEAGNIRIGDVTG